MQSFHWRKRDIGMRGTIPERLITPQGEGRNRTEWSVPWSDLMMVMFILFLVLFVYSTKLKVIPQFSGGNTPHSAQIEEDGRIRYIGASPEMQKNLEGIFHRLQDELQNHAAMTRLSYSEDKGIVISLHGETIFTPGGPNLSSDARPVLEKIAEVLFLVRSTVLVAGFSDRFAEIQGSERKDLELSALRAVQVTCFFTEENGLEPEMFVVQGYGAAKPLYPGNIPENVSRNQRVEITITGNPV
ncbi:MAG: OmpA/MotB family protein [bacterium]